MDSDLPSAIRALIFAQARCDPPSQTRASTWLVVFFFMINCTLLKTVLSSQFKLASFFLPLPAFFSAKESKRELLS